MPMSKRIFSSLEICLTIHDVLRLIDCTKRIPRVTTIDGLDDQESLRTKRADDSNDMKVFT
jgi:hypothetical protein